MRNDLHKGSVIFWCGAHLYVVVSVFASVFFTLGVLVGLRKDDWIFPVIDSGSTAVVFSILAYLRLEIWESEFTYRNLRGTRSVEFGEIEKAGVETVTGEGGSVAVFWVELRNRGKMKINLRTFPIRAAAQLFIALESHAIPINVPDGWAAQRMAGQIREERPKSPD